MTERHDIEAALARCEDEPIHIPGSIQPHGYLLCLTPHELKVVQISQNVGDLLKRPPEAILGQSLATLGSPALAAAITSALSVSTLAEINPLRVDVNDQRYDGILSRSDGLVVLELEPHQATDGLGRAFSRAMRLLQAVDDIETLKEIVVEEVRRLTGYDRVMLYRFAPSGYGEVWAEAKDDALEPFLGLRYPASDIPQQARELYRRNWVRIIPDARYVPSPLVPANRRDTGQPLDLSPTVLRSVSPVHCEYMNNMGVRGSMSISLLRRHELWGLISCNHTEPKFVPYEVRAACQTIGRLLSVQIDAFEERARSRTREERRPLQDRLSTAADAAAGSVTLAVLQNAADLLALTAACGAAVIIGDEVTAIGDCPPRATILELGQLIARQHEGAGIFATSSAGTIPEHDLQHPAATGILAAWLPRPDNNMILWFRPELVTTVRWAGDPRKAEPSGLSAARLSPRKSFAAWQEQERGNALPWTPADIEAAEELRRRLIEIDLAHQVLRERAAVQARDDLLAVVSHDLRSPLTAISLQASMMKRDLITQSPESTQRT
ncbi:MAG: GAF domain-containing protein, partial [Spongiibacteraceae bacterium]|nr:GAF domain-containing protein [Spongiibacteraceae bacterium]